MLRSVTNSNFESLFRNRCVAGELCALLPFNPRLRRIVVRGRYIFLLPYYTRNVQFMNLIN